MQTVDGRLILSPSDLNDHIECPHLTTRRSKSRAASASAVPCRRPR